MTDSPRSLRRPAVAALLLAACAATFGAACGRDAPRAAGDSGAGRGDSARGGTARLDTAPGGAAAGSPPGAPAAARGRWTVPCLRVTEDVTALARDTVCFRDERTYDLAGDGRPFTLSVEARGPRHDSLRVMLRITRGDSVLYRDAWNTTLYGSYDDRRPSADSARRRAEHHLARLLSDEAFRPAIDLVAGASDRERMLRETIAFDVSVAGERRRRRLGPAARLPESARQSPRPSADTARVRALAAELRERPAFRYYAGGEASYAVAWSPSERRFVVVYSCC